MSDEQKQEEVKTEEVVEETKKEEPKAEVPSKYKKLVEEIEKMPLAEVAELVKALEDRWGVAAVAAASPVAGAAPAQAPAEEEKAHFTIVLADAGAQKIAVIKAVREIKPNLGLKEAKDLVDGAPKEVLKDVKKDDAQAAKTKLEAAGAKVELK